MSADRDPFKHVEDHWPDYTLDMFAMSVGSDLEEMELFHHLWQTVGARHKAVWATTHAGGAGPEREIVRDDGERFQVVNLSTYDYLGYGHHPEAIRASVTAIAQYGLGSCSSPVVTRCALHRELEQALVRFFGLPSRRATVFGSGYGVNVGAIQAFIRPGNCVLVDASAHISIHQGARASGGTVAVFPHNDMAALERLLVQHCDPGTRVLICVDALYSCDGDRAPLRAIVDLAKRHGAFTLVDEAHSALIAGELGRGVCEEQGVLDEVDMIVLTFTKALASLGGAVIARPEISRYLDCFASTRVFTAALPPAVLGGMVKILELVGGEDGQRRRRKIKENTALLHGLLRGKVDLGTSDSWIVTVMCGPDNTVIETLDFLQRNGLDAPIMVFPAVPKDRARLRMFVTAEHSREQLERAADILLRAADAFGFPPSPRLRGDQP